MTMPGRAHSSVDPGTLSVCDRDPDSAVFHGPDGIVTAREFLAQASGQAAVIDAEAGHGQAVANMARDRGLLAQGLAAALLAGRTTLLGGDRDTLENCLVLSEGIPEAEAFRCIDLTQRRRCGDQSWSDPSKTAIAVRVFTSGSTGQPVGHAKRWQALAARTRAAALQFGLDRSRPASIVGTIPANHMYGLETTVLLPLHAPACSWTGPAFYPDDVRQALIIMPEPRILVTTPLQLRVLLESGAVLPPLASIISASAPLSTELADAAEQRWQTRVLEIFGATEVGSIASRRTVEQRPWRLYPGVRLIRQDGLVLVEADGALPEPLQDDVQLLDDRHFRLLGRRSDLVKVGGRRASLEGLNAVLAAIDGVEDGIFVPPDDKEASGPAARMQVYVVAPGRRAPDILSALRLRIDPAFLPREVVLLDRLPRNAMGKLPRQALRALRTAR